VFNKRNLLKVLIAFVLLVSVSTGNKSLSASYSGYSCANYAIDNYFKVVYDGYIMGYSSIIHKTHAFKVSSGSRMSDYEDNLYYWGVKYTAYDCAHFVSSSLIHGGNLFLPNDYQDQDGVEGFVSASKLHNYLVNNYNFPSISITDAINDGLISVGDPVFFKSINSDGEYSISHSGVYVGDDLVAYHSSNNINQYYNVSNDVVIVHIVYNEDDYNDWNQKFRFNNRVIVNELVGSERLRIRNSPEIRNDNIAGFVNRNTIGHIVNGTSVFKDNYYWWEVSFNNGLKGWCAGKYLKRN
jgi:hypothetical protein